MPDRTIPTETKELQKLIDDLSQAYVYYYQGVKDATADKVIKAKDAWETAFRKKHNMTETEFIKSFEFDAYGRTYIMIFDDRTETGLDHFLDPDKNQ